MPKVLSCPLIERIFWVYFLDERLSLTTKSHHRYKITMTMFIRYSYCCFLLMVSRIVTYKFWSNKRDSTVFEINMLNISRIKYITLYFWVCSINLSIITKVILAVTTVLSRWEVFPMAGSETIFSTESVWARAVGAVEHKAKFCQAGTLHTLTCFTEPRPLAEEIVVAFIHIWTISSERISIFSNY